MATNVVRAKSPLILGVSVGIAALDWFFMFYITSYNFELKVQNISLGGLNLAFPIQWLTVLGVFLVALVAWYEVTARVFPRRAGPEIDPMANMRLLRAVGFSVAAFVIVLYVPYLLGSVWFWARVSKVGRSIPGILGPGRSLLNAQEPFMTMDPVYQYSLSQILATAAMVFVAWLSVRIARRPRKPR